MSVSPLEFEDCWSSRLSVSPLEFTLERVIFGGLRPPNTLKRELQRAHGIPGERFSSWLFAPRGLPVLHWQAGFRIENVRKTHG